MSKDVNVNGASNEETTAKEDVKIANYVTSETEKTTGKKGGGKNVKKDVKKAVAEKDVDKDVDTAADKEGTDFELPETSADIDDEDTMLDEEIEDAIKEINELEEEDEESETNGEKKITDGIVFKASKRNTFDGLTDDTERIINNMTEDEAKEFLNLNDDKDELVTEIDDVSFNHGEITSQEDTEFFLNSYNGDKATSEEELWNILENIRRTHHIMPATMIGCEYQPILIKRNGQQTQRYLMYVMLQLPKPYDRFIVYVSYYDFYTEKERKLFEEHYRKTRNSYPEKGSQAEIKYQSLILDRQVGFQFEITLTKTIKNSKTIFGSRVEALKRRFNQYFNSGVLIDGKVQKPKKGSIIRGCPVTRISRTSVGVDLCGVPTTIYAREVSYCFNSSPLEILKPSDVVDVLICKIKKKGAGNKPEDVVITASIKKAAPDPTIPALKKEMKKNIVQSKVLGKIVYINQDRNHYCYHIFTDKGYNCIALSSKSSKLKETYGKLSSYVKEPKVGMKAIVKPMRIINNVMIGVICNCWW